MLSELCKLNNGLALQKQCIIDSEWKPGQVFCNLHYTLAIAQGVRSVISSYQSKIWPKKSFPKTVGFEMDLEDKLLIVQI